MATNVDGKKISALTESQTVSDTDQIVIETKSGTRRVSAGVIADFTQNEKSPEGTIGFNTKAKRYAHNVVIGQNGSVKGYIYAYFGSNMTATTVDTATTVVTGYVEIDNPKLYLVELMTIPGNLFNLDSAEYKVIGTCSASRTTDDSTWIPSFGPALAGYDGAQTIIYGWKGTSSSLKKLNNVVNIYYVPE